MLNAYFKRTFKPGPNLIALIANYFVHRVLIGAQLRFQYVDAEIFSPRNIDSDFGHCTYKASQHSLRQ